MSCSRRTRANAFRVLLIPSVTKCLLRQPWLIAHVAAPLFCVHLRCVGSMSCESVFSSICLRGEPGTANAVYVGAFVTLDFGDVAEWLWQIRYPKQESETDRVSLSSAKQAAECAEVLAVSGVLQAMLQAPCGSCGDQMSRSHSAGLRCSSCGWLDQVHWK